MPFMSTIYKQYYMYVLLGIYVKYIYKIDNQDNLL